MFLNVPRRHRIGTHCVISIVSALAGTVASAADGGVPAPFLSFGAKPVEIVAGDKARLSWASLNAAACTASGDWSGEQPVNGRFDTPVLSKPMTYTLSCTGPGGSVERQVLVKVLDTSPQVVAVPDGVETVDSATLTLPAEPLAPVSTPAPPEPAVTPAADGTSATLTLSASPSAVAYGGETTLTWSAKDASKCIASGAWGGTKSPSGREVLRGLNGESRFSLTCMGARGATSREVVVNVGAAAPVSVDLRTTAADIVQNGSTTLVWTASGAQACTASGAWFGPRSTHGSESTDALTMSSTFAITCTGLGGSASDSVAVNVSPHETAAAMSYTASE